MKYNIINDNNVVRTAFLVIFNCLNKIINSRIINKNKKIILYMNQPPWNLIYSIYIFLVVKILLLFYNNRFF